MKVGQTVHIPIRSERVLSFLKAKYTTLDYYQLSHKHTIGLFIATILVTKKHSENFPNVCSQNTFNIHLGSYKHMDQKCFLKSTKIEEFNLYAENKMKEYFYEWMKFYASMPKIDIKACIEKFLEIHNMPDTETDVEFFRTSYKRHVKSILINKQSHDNNRQIK